jgi:two-component system LytT family sensor kinase
MLLPVVFFSRPKDVSFFPDQIFTLYFVSSNLFFIAFYYFNAYFLIPKLLVQKKLLTYIFVIFLLLILFGMYPRFYDYLSDNYFKIPRSPWHGTRPKNVERPLLSPGSISIFLLIFAISTGIKVVGQWFQSENRNKEIENEKLTTELFFLKSQINPHFLFNTLNNIYSLAAVQSEKTAEAVMKLSSIMRYVLTEVKNDCVPLEKEILFITHYIELQKLRLTDKTKVDFTVTGETFGKQISPLLFLPFVENAFKYGISTRELSPVIILLEIKNTDLYFTVKNNKHTSTLIKPANNTGIGIENARRRLELLYKNRYQLDITEDLTTFTVNLNINMQ